MFVYSFFCNLPIFTATSWGFMKMSTQHTIGFLVLLLLSHWGFAQKAKGNLFIIGGGKRPDALMQQLLETATAARLYCCVTNGKQRTQQRFLLPCQTVYLSCSLLHC